ncbi:MAG TPA: ABC transporter ATP-binding protein [Chloroflexia bacterium]|nr:ABC transporter ATP-binding protein [Chloroflexia bacterium]
MTGTGAPAIETEGLTKFYGTGRGILDLDLRVERGEIFGFLGPNGAGKTTTIRLLMDLIRPTGGRARVFGHDAQTDSVAVRALSGYLPGEMALWPGLTGLQTLTYLGNLRGGVPPATIAALAERLDLDLTKKFREYSRGNKQKVGLVQAFMHRPRLLILDEPTTGLDPLNQQEFYRLVAEARAAGATVFLSSHILSEVEHIGDRVGIVRDGRLVRVASVREVMAEKRHRVSITFATPPDALARTTLTAVPGVSDVTALGNELHFAAQGDLAPVIRWAAAHPITNLTSHEPTLEEVFLDYYKEPDAATPPEPVAAGSRDGG